MFFEEEFHWLCCCVYNKLLQKMACVQTVLFIDTCWKGTVPFFLQRKTKSFLLKGHRKLRRNVRHTDWPIQNIIKLALKRQHLHYEGERSDCILYALIMQVVPIRPWDNLALQKMSVCGGCGWVGGTLWCNAAKIISLAHFLLNYWTYPFLHKMHIFSSIITLVHFIFPIH